MDAYLQPLNVITQQSSGRKFGLVSWHINHCRSFNAKSSQYTYIKYMISEHIL